MLTFCSAPSRTEATEKSEEMTKTHENRGSMLPVVVGGVIGIIGSVVGGVTLFKLQAGQERKVFKRSKLEELVSFAYECDEWLDQLKLKYLVYGDIDTIVQKFPLSRMRMIQTLYFPTLEKDVQALSSAVEVFRQLLILERPHLRQKKEYSDDFKAQYEPKQKAVLDAIQALTEKAATLDI